MKRINFNGQSSKECLNTHANNGESTLSQPYLW